MKKVYATFCKIEEIIACTLIMTIASLVFISAIARTIKHPLNWAQDISLLLFSWAVFLGADMALRHADFVRVDMIVNKLPKIVSSLLYYFWYFVIIIFLIILIRYGIPLSLQNYKRLFQTLGISYSYATISVPVGSFLMIITIILKLIKRFISGKEGDNKSWEL
jgi:TRAP-type C4-dicarboxylate transport system permease small subunit